MIAFASMLIQPALEAGIKVPVDEENYDKNEFPHFFVFCWVQLCTPMPIPSAHWENAKIIASVPDDKIMSITYDELVEMGLVV